MTDTQNPEFDSTDMVPTLVEEKESIDYGLPVPRGLKVIGKVVYWKDGPNFAEAAAHLDSGSDVKPGQFVGAWHGFLLSIRERRTPVGGSTPKVFSGRKKVNLTKEGSK